jgi:tripartite-type tricarboxylate transporter receptor subunit TctC
MCVIRFLPLLVLAILSQFKPVFAAEWPQKTVRIIVPFGAGSTPDSLARLLADQLQAKYGKSFIVENKPGASGNLGTDAVAKGEPDGYTLGVSIVGPLAINTLLFSNLPYDPLKDLALITIVEATPSILVATPNLRAKSVEELIALLRREPGKYNFGSIGNGSLSHLSMEAIGIKSGTQSVHVPFAGSPEALIALMRGDVQMAVLPALSVAPQIQAGKINALAVTSSQRSSLFPNLPTLKEAGLLDVEADAWVGLIAPSKTDPTLLTKIREAILQMLADTQVRQKLKLMYMEPIGSSPEEFRATIKAELARWAPVIRASNIKID